MSNRFGDPTLTLSRPPELRDEFMNSNIEESFDIDEAERFLNTFIDFEKITFHCHHEPCALDNKFTFNKTSKFTDIIDTLKNYSKYGSCVAIYANELRSDCVDKSPSKFDGSICGILYIRVDLDNVPLPPSSHWKIDPNLILETSPNRYQCFWFLTKKSRYTLDISHAENIGKTISRTCGADVSGTSLHTPVRLPGFPNHKYNRWNLVKITHIDSTLIELEDLEKAYPVEIKPEQPQEDVFEGIAQSKFNLREWSIFLSALNRIPSNISRIDWLINLARIADLPTDFDTQVKIADDWSAARYVPDAIINIRADELKYSGYTDVLKMMQDLVEHRAERLKTGAPIDHWQGILKEATTYHNSRYSTSYERWSEVWKNNVDLQIEGSRIFKGLNPPTALEPIQPIAECIKIPSYEWPMLDGKETVSFSSKEVFKRLSYLRLVDDQTLASIDDFVECINWKGQTRCVLALGPSAGKTTIFRLFTGVYYSHGILLLVWKIEDVKRMQFDLVCEVGARIVETTRKIDLSHYDEITTSLILKRGLETVYGLYNSGTAEYREDPESTLKKYKVVVATYDKILDDNPAWFSHLNLQFIDELPKLYDEIEVSDSNLIELIGEIVTKNSLTHHTPDVAIQMIINNLETYVPSTHRLFKRIVQPGGNPESIRYKYRFFNRLNHVLEKYREKIKDVNFSSGRILDLLKCYNAHRQRDYYLPLVNRLIAKHIVIMDGTGDIIFKDSSIWTVIVKYQPKVNIERIELFDNRIELRMIYNENSNQYDEHIKNLEYFNDQVKLELMTLPENEKLLLIVRLNEGVMCKCKIPATDRLKAINVEREFLNAETRVRMSLSDAENQRVYITHYQSGKTRTTSEFKDATGVIFAELWYIPEDAVLRQRDTTGNELTSVENTVAEMKQAIFRSILRVRNNNGLRFLKFPLGINPKLAVSVLEEIGYDVKDEDYRLLLKGLNIFMYELRHQATGLSKNYIVDFWKLIEAYPAIFDQTSTGFNISLDELYNVIPRSRKKRQEYQDFIDAIKDGLKVTINIVKSAAENRADCVQTIAEVIGLSKPHTKSFRKLCEAYPDFITDRKLELTLSELFKAVPRSRKEFDKYHEFITALNLRGLKLSIKTEEIT